MRAAACVAATLLPVCAWAREGAVTSLSPWLLLGQAMLSLAVVVGIIYLVYFGLKRLESRQLRAEVEGPIRVTQARHLGGDRWLYLVEIEGRRIVVGAAGGQIATVAELGDPGGESDGAL